MNFRDRIRIGLGVILAFLLAGFILHKLHGQTRIDSPTQTQWRPGFSVVQMYSCMTGSCEGLKYMRLKWADGTITPHILSPPPPGFVPTGGGWVIDTVTVPDTATAVRCVDTKP